MLSPISREKGQDPARHLGPRPDLHDADGEQVPGLHVARRQLLADEHRLSTAQQVARQERPVAHDVAHLVQAHDGRPQRRHIALVGHGLFPAPPLQVVVDDIAAVLELGRQHVLQDAEEQIGHKSISDHVRQLIDPQVGCRTRCLQMELEQFLERRCPFLTLEPLRHAG